MAAAGSGAVSPMPSGIAGEGQPMSVMPPSLTLNYVIAVQGWFPSRQ
jgi:microcystin-dependent protein